ncbi:hypothetical protein [Ruminococcus flavefaciens]|uniref:hypothetical protein n=1 Tax=Ruminococcus flavefaciens TaxID=1265 RepID=UPI00048F4592|nr:hypothetical protein [Ruminococcus flavefaciens]
MNGCLKYLIEKHHLERYRIPALILLVILTFGLLMLKAEVSFQLDSESLVGDPIIALINHHEIDQSQFGLGYLNNNGSQMMYLYLLEEDPTLENEYTYTTYYSQLGLQGYFFCAVTRLFRDIRMITWFRWSCCAVFSALLVAITIQLYRRYHLLYAICFWAISVNSNWISSFSPNLYWVMFTWFVPMLLGILCLTHDKYRKLLYPLFFASVIIKSLCGFEYLSTILIAAEVWLAAEWILHKEKRASLFRCILISGLCMLAGFAVAAVVQMAVYGNGNIRQGYDFFMHYLVHRRTFGNPEEFNPAYFDSLNASSGTVLKKYLWDYEEGKKMLLLLVASLLFLLTDRVLFKRDRKQDLSLLLLHLAAPLSWFILAKSHSYIHTHINFVLYYLGFAQTAAYCLIATVTSHIRIVAPDGSEKIQPDGKIILKFVK